MKRLRPRARWLPSVTRGNSALARPAAPRAGWLNCALGKIAIWIVDTCVVLGVFEHDPTFGRPSAELLQKLSAQGLAVSPVTMVELSAAFTGNLAEQKNFLDLAGISYVEPWTAIDTEHAHTAWLT